MNMPDKDRTLANAYKGILEVLRDIKKIEKDIDEDKFEDLKQDMETALMMIQDIRSQIRHL